MEEGGGHDFFVLVVFFWRRRGRRIFFFLLLGFVRFLFGWLVGWGCSFLVSCLRELIFLYQLSPIIQDADMLFSFSFFFLSLFFSVELEGWLDYASPGRAD